MADDDNTPSHVPPAVPVPTGAAPLAETALSQDRPQLIERARAFLMSPAVQQQDMIAKRQFLLDKGLSEPEIANIFRDLVCGMQPSYCDAERVYSQPKCLLSLPGPTRCRRRPTYRLCYSVSSGYFRGLQVLLRC